MATSWGEMPTTSVRGLISPLRRSIRIGGVQLGPMLLRDRHVGEHVSFGLVEEAGELRQLGAELIGNLAPLRTRGIGIVFCDLFREFERRLSPTMRQDHPAGDKVFVDYSGKKVMIVDREPGLCARRRSSPPCLAPRITPAPRRPGRRNWRTGSRPSSGSSGSLAGYRALSSPTI